MNDTKNLQGKTILYRLVGIGVPAVHKGKVIGYEEHGLWIDPESLIGDFNRDLAWKPMLDQITGTPRLFVPFSSLVFLMVGDE